MTQILADVLKIQEPTAGPCIILNIFRAFYSAFSAFTSAAAGFIELR